MGEKVRLDRFLAEAGIGTRAEVKKLIRSGRILVKTAVQTQGTQNTQKVSGQVNQEALHADTPEQDAIQGAMPVTKSDWKVDPDVDEVWMDRKPVRRFQIPVLMLHKPAGVVSATRDDRDRTVLDLVHEPYAKDLFPVGRLDRDTEGLLLLTNDGKMSHELLSPKKHVQKTYFAVIDGSPDPKLAERFLEGLEIGEKKPTLPASLVFLDRNGAALYSEEMDTAGGGESLRLREGDDCLKKKGSQAGNPTAAMVSGQDLKRCGEEECCVIVTITEGKFHQIKRMFGAVGREVHYLKRLSMGGLWLDPLLAPGQYRPLTAEERNLLTNSPPGDDAPGL